MKLDKKLLLALLALIGVVFWLVLLSTDSKNVTNQNEINTQNIKELTDLNSQLQSKLSTIQDQNTDLQHKLQTLLDNPPKNGVDGANGKDGLSGQNGVSGINGKDGSSAYDLWLSIGNTGSIADFLNSLVGQDGKPAREVQFRCNDNKLRNEWRYVGDSTWRPLNKVEACA